MDRVTVYPGQIPLETDVLRTNKFGMMAVAKLAAAMLGTSTVVNGLACVATSPASLQVNVNPGEMYSLVNVDATPYSSLSADTTHSILKQGISLDAVTLSCPAPATGGQSINYLIQATYQDSDTDNTALPYYNASNPSQAWSGPNNSGTPQSTTRKGAIVISAKAGTAATTGTQTTPAADSGYTGLWVVTVANGQSTITSSNIAQATNAPILPTDLLHAIQQSSLTVASDTGSANTYVVSYTPPITALTDGMVLWFKAKTANTGASTINVNGLGTVPLVGGAHAALQGNEIIANGKCQVVYKADISSFVLIECTGGALQIASATQSQQAAQLGQIANIQGALKNLQASATGTSSNVSVTVDEIALETTTNFYLLARGVSLTINSAASGANGLDTGTLAASTWYSVWVISNGTTVAGLLSLSATAPTLPSGYIYRARVGWIKTDGTGFKYPLSFVQQGRSVQYKVASSSNVTTLPALASGVQGSIGGPGVQIIAAAIPIPSTAAKVRLVLFVGASATIQVSPNSNMASGPGSPAITVGTTTANLNVAAELVMESSSLYYAGNGSSTICTASVLGWEDNL